MADQQATEKATSLDFSRMEAGDEVYEDMAKHGILYGHKKSRKNPKFADYVFSTRNGVEVLDLQKTLSSIEIIASVLKKNKDEKKLFMLVGTQPAAHEAVRKLADTLGNSSCVTGKWTGGLITNFSVLGKRLEYLKKRQADIKDGKFDKYTKKERLMIEREIKKLSEKFAGVENMERVPDVLFVVDGNVKNHRTAIREAHIKKMLVVGIIDNDDNPDDFDYFIPANDHAKASIDWVINSLCEKIKS